MPTSKNAAGKSRFIALASSVALASTIALAGASAATLQVVGGVSAVLPVGGVNGGFDPSGTWNGVSNDGVNAGDTVKVFYGNTIANAGLKVAPFTVDLTFTFMGKEAGNTNQSIFWNSTELLSTGSSLGASKSVAGFNTQPNGWVPLTFKTDGQYTGNAGSYITNGVGAVQSGGAGLYMAFSQVFTGDGSNGGVLGSSWVYAFFGDGLGDRDFDDMIVKIYAYSDPGASGSAGGLEAPLPPALVLFGSALIGLGAMARRRRKQASGA